MTKYEHDRRQHRQERGHDHLLDGGPGQHVDGAGVVRPVRALHDAAVLAELAAHLLDDGAGGAPDRRHGDAAEEVGDEAAEQEADDDVGVRQREVDGDAPEVLVGGRAGAVRLGDEEVEVRGVGRKQHQRAEARRADGVALGHRLGGVADRVERVGRLAHLLRQPGHLGDAAGIVGHRPEGVERDDEAGERQHRGDRDRDAEQAGERVGRDDAGDDDERRQRRRFERDREALDDVRAVAGDARPRRSTSPGGSSCRCSTR